MNATTKRWVGYFGYPVIYLGMLAIFARVTFPYERVKERLVAEFNAKQAASGLRLDIEEMSGRYLFGVEAENVKLTRTPPIDPMSFGSTVEEQKPKVTVIDELYGSISVWRLLFGRVAGSFGATMQAGEIEGDFSSSDAEQSLAVKLSQVAVGDIPMISDLAGLPLKGLVDGEIDVTLPEKLPTKAEGKVTLTMDGISAGDGKAKVLKVIALPELKVGTVKVAATITEGKVKLDTVSAKGADFEMIMDGNVRLREPIGSSLLDMGMRFRFLDSYKNKNDITKGLFGSNGVPGLFEMDEKVRRAKREDGFYGWRVVGTMEKPLVEPNPSGTASTGRASVRGAATHRNAKSPTPNGL
jgi:type II secretion system protein N